MQNLNYFLKLNKYRSYDNNTSQHFAVWRHSSFHLTNSNLIAWYDRAINQLYNLSTKLNQGWQEVIFNAS